MRKHFKKGVRELVPVSRFSYTVWSGTYPLLPSLTSPPGSLTSVDRCLQRKQGRTSTVDTKVLCHVLDGYLLCRDGICDQGRETEAVVWTPVSLKDLDPGRTIRSV